nr:hypothetical protein [Gloeotrichia echinulata DEX184]
MVEVFGTGDTTTGSVHRWGHNDRLSASLGTQRPAQCIAGDWEIPVIN